MDTNSNTDGYHVFRATLNGTAGGINVSRDGIQVADQVTPTTARTRCNNCSWASGAGGAAGESLLDYIAFTPGTCSPVLRTVQHRSVRLRAGRPVGLRLAEAEVAATTSPLSRFGRGDDKQR